MDSQPAEAFPLVVQFGPGSFLPGHILAASLNQKGRWEQCLGCICFLFKSVIR